MYTCHMGRSDDRMVSGVAIVFKYGGQRNMDLRVQHVGAHDEKKRFRGSIDWMLDSTGTETPKVA